MKEEIIQRVLEIPLENWTGHYMTAINGTKIILMRGEGGSGSYWLEIDGVKIYHKSLRNLYYDLYERERKGDPNELSPIYNKLCKIHK